ncbi:MAG TPA: hypothetical protein VG873_02095 [Burkholderiales bacterium]|nr:hypothetical protein [Burkholderiales bacterium]
MLKNDARLFGLAAALAFGAYVWLYLPRFAAGAGWGDDYALHFPNLLAGCYWHARNGPLAIPWFSPAQCGGVPFLGDLNVAYYALPQWLSLAAGPIPAVQATFLAFAAAGGAGTFVLLRSRFRLEAGPAAAGAVLFLFSTFYTARMVAGHLTFHPFTLVPWLAWIALGPAGPWRTTLARAAACALAFAYMFEAGMVHGILPALLAVAIMVLVHGQLYGAQARPWIVLSLAALLALALGAQRLAASLAFLAQFPRADYALPGFPALADAAGFALQALFWRPPLLGISASLANQQWDMEVHELAFGVGPAALAAILAGAFAAARRGRLPGAAAGWGLVVLLLALPLALNWHLEPWNALLKRLPLFGSSSSLLRWYAAYIPVAVLLAALALQGFRRDPVRRAAALAVIAATAGWNFLADDMRYISASYDPRPIQAAWERLGRDGVPAVERIVVRKDASGQPSGEVDRNDALAVGGSQALCYQPMFGYRLERLPGGPLREGPALGEAAPGFLNVRNPACFAYPAANACSPGGLFPVAARAQAERFLRYEAFEPVLPPWQRAATAASLLALAICLGLIASARRRSR